MSSSTDSIRTVWLLKKGGLRHQWMKRFFVLHGSFFLYYSDQQDFKRSLSAPTESDKSRGRYNLKNATVQPLSFKDDRAYKSGYSFIVVPESGKTLVVGTDSERERDEWLQILSTRIEVATGLPPSTDTPAPDIAGGGGLAVADADDIRNSVSASAHDDSTSVSVSSTPIHSKRSPAANHTNTNTNTTSLSPHTVSNGTTNGTSGTSGSNGVVQESICFACKRGFGLTRRRHSCKQCLHHFCSSCANRKIQLPAIGNQMARVCDSCFKNVLENSANAKFETASISVSNHPSSASVSRRHEQDQDANSATATPKRNANGAARVSNYTFTSPANTTATNNLSTTPRPNLSVSTRGSPVHRASDESDEDDRLRVRALQNTTSSNNNSKTSSSSSTNGSSELGTSGSNGSVPSLLASQQSDKFMKLHDHDESNTTLPPSTSTSTTSTASTASSSTSSLSSSSSSASSASSASTASLASPSSAVLTPTPSSPLAASSSSSYSSNTTTTTTPSKPTTNGHTPTGDSLDPDAPQLRKKTRFFFCCM